MAALAELERVEDPSLPLKLRVPLASGVESRWQIWQTFCTTLLPRDYDDVLSEVKEASEFTEEQRQLLVHLSQKDYATILADHEDASFRNVGVPAPLALRRMWLGLDEAGAWNRRVEFECSTLGRTLECSLWKALYVSYWLDEDIERASELLQSVDRVSLVDFFYRASSLDPFYASLFAQPITELGRELVPEYVSQPEPALVAWAEREAARLLRSSEGERESCDATLVLAVLAARLPTGAYLPASFSELFSLEPGWTADRYGELIEHVPPATQVAALTRSLDAVVSLCAEPLRPGVTWSSILPYLETLEPAAPEIVRMVADAAIACEQRCPRAAIATLRDAGVAEWLLARLEAPALGGATSARHAELLERLKTTPVEKLEILKRPLVLVDRNTIARLDGPIVEQIQAIGQHFWGTKTLQEIWAKTESHQLAWLRCPTVDDCEQRLADVWTAKCKGDVVFGIVFPPDRAAPLPHIVWEGRAFVGTTADAQQLVARIRYPFRKGEAPELLEDWDAYLKTLGIKR